MKKLILFTVFILLLFINIDVYAVKYNTLSEDVKVTFENFVNYFNTGNEEIYNIINLENDELHSSIQKYLNSANIGYKVIEVEIMDENYYRINTILDAKGHESFYNWEISGHKVYFDISFIDNGYKITDTDLFDNIGYENVSESIDSFFKIFLIIGTVIIGFWLIIVLIIILYCIFKNKKIK